MMIMKDVEVWKYYPTNCTDSETNHGPDIYDVNLTWTSEHKASMLTIQLLCWCITNVTELKKTNMTVS